MSDSIKEALKELARVVVLAVIPIAIDGLTKGEIDYKILLVAGLIAFLRGLDKLLHEIGKAKENDLLKKGLTRF